MALARVQSTGKVTGDNVTVLTFTFPSPPTVGNGIAVAIISWSNPDFALATVTDNRGNTYQLAQQARGGTDAAVFFCPKIAATGSPFTITFTSSTTDDFVGAATEIGGLGAGSLAVDQTATNFNFASTATAGPTAALSASDVFVVGVFSTSQSQASITAESVSPAWVQEFEELSTLLVAGEADTRALTGVAGATTSVSWALASSGAFRALLVAFKVVTLAGPDARVSQLVVETLSHDALSEPRVSQLVVETLSSLAAVLPDARLSQLVVETLTLPPPSVPLRTTQLVAELLNTVPNSPVSTTQVAAELVLALPPQPDQARVTQLCCELIIVPRLPICVVEFPIDPAEPTSCAVNFPLPATSG